MGTGSGSMGNGSGGVRVAPPSAWKRAGLVLEAGADGVGAQVLGDPCVVRDDEAGLWRMFLFALPPGHAEATCAGDPADPKAWTLRGPIAFTNPQVLQGRWVFKPFVVLDPAKPGRAATIDGLYALLLVTEWSVFRSPDWDRVRSMMRRHRIYDGRNLWSSDALRTAGFTYWGIGRA